MNQNKRGTWLVERNTVLGILILAVGYYILPLVVSIVIADWLSTYVTLPILFITGIITCMVFLLVFLIYKVRFGFYTASENETHKKLPDFFYIGCVFLFFLLYVLVQFLMAERKSTWTSSAALAALGSSLAAGFSEELFFRGILLSYLIAKLKLKSNGIQLSVIISTLLFAFAHLVNFSFSSYSVTDFMYQFFVAFCLGLFLCSLFLQTASLWQCMVIHFAWDFFFFVMNASFGAPAMLWINTGMYLLFEVFMGIYGWKVIRKG